MSLTLEPIKRTDPRILANMSIHYSAPKGFVGRNICYAVLFAGVCYGSIVGGSATLHLPGRNEFFGLAAKPTSADLNRIVNNIFFHVEKVDGEYPVRHFTAKVIKAFRERIVQDWLAKYGDQVMGFETLVELPRTGDCYKRDDWTLTGQTIGYTCKRGGGQGTDAWSGKRVWDTKNLRPKLVFCRRVE